MTACSLRREICRFCSYYIQTRKVFHPALDCRSNLGWVSMMPSEGTGTTEDFASTIARYCAKEADFEEYLVQMNRVHRYWEVKHWVVKLHKLCTLWANNTLAKDLEILTSETLYFSKDLFWKCICTFKTELIHSWTSSPYMFSIVSLKIGTV